MKRLAVVSLTFLVLAGASWLAWAVRKDRLLDNRISMIKPGNTDAAVLQKLGRPKKIEPCGAFFGPLTPDEATGCAREYLYGSPFAPLVPRYYVVRFDLQGHVMSTTVYTSP